MNRKLSDLEQVIGYQFHDEDLLAHAMTHSSYSNEKHWEKTKNNERLEFLGDAVLELVSSDFLFHKHEKMPEGEMTRTRASMVCEQALAYCAGEIHLGEYLRLGRGEESTGGRERSSVVSDALEALIGAIYLDGGFASAKEFIHRFILNDLENKQLFYDSKTILQELVQGMGKETLTYELLGEEGPEHNRIYETCAKVGGREIGRGQGRSKKAAEQMAAYRGILKLKAETGETREE